MSENKLSDLFHRYFEGIATTEEQAEFMALLDKAENDSSLNSLLEEAWRKLGNDEKVFSRGQSETILQNLLQGARSSGAAQHAVTGALQSSGPDAGSDIGPSSGSDSDSNSDIGTDSIPLGAGRKGSPYRIWRWSAAAVLLLALGTAAWFQFYRGHRDQGPVIARLPSNPGRVDVPAPSGNHAILTLSDGSVVALDSARAGAINCHCAARVAKTDTNQLVYDAAPAGNKTEIAEQAYNTISTRRGGQFRLVLPDGSKVWLNTMSSLRFPSAFSGNERLVELTGEAYFEVSKNSSMPFRVHVTGESETKEMDIRVLGTNFNVMAYNNEEEVKTTLVEGAVKVVKGAKSKVLAPGEQMRVDKDGAFAVEENTDIELALAWKNGFTSFKSADIKSIMRQVERWYDIEVVYVGDIPERTFSGGISRSANLSELIRLLQASKINFKLDGRKLTVMP